MRRSLKQTNVHKLNIYLKINERIKINIKQFNEKLLKVKNNTNKYTFKTKYRK